MEEKDMILFNKSHGVVQMYATLHKIFTLPVTYNSDMKKVRTLKRKP